MNNKLKILNIVPLPSYDFNDGGAINFLNRTKYLVEKGHKIDFIIFKDKSQKISAFEKAYASSNILIIKLKNKELSLLKSILTSRPYGFFRHNLTTKESLKLMNFIDKNKYDVVIFETIQSYPIYLKLKNKIDAQKVYFAHNIDYLDILNGANNSRGLKKSILMIESAKDRKVEVKYLKEFKLIFSVSPKDMDIIRQISPNSKIMFCPAIVDIDMKIDRFSNDKIKDSISYQHKILFTGNLSYPSNITAVRWFVESIMPILRKKLNVCFIVVGRKPVKEVLELKEKYLDVLLFQDVESLAPFYNTVDLVVIPLFNQAGVKIKLIEALKYGKKIVSRPEGVYGSGLSDIIPTADTPEDFAQKCIDVLEGKIDFGPIWKKFNEIYDNQKIIDDFEKSLFEFINNI
mgnify:CR=1 FL=1|jgi:glycosyltransferase involved in cell wall biosynthesis